MDKYEQITKLAQAADLIHEVIQHVDPEFVDELNIMYDDIADLADQIEGYEE